MRGYKNIAAIAVALGIALHPSDIDAYKNSLIPNHNTLGNEPNIISRLEDDSNRKNLSDESIAQICDRPLNFNYDLSPSNVNLESFECKFYDENKNLRDCKDLKKSSDSYLSLRLYYDVHIFDSDGIECVFIGRNIAGGQGGYIDEGTFDYVLPVRENIEVSLPDRFQKPLTVFVVDKLGNHTRFEFYPKDFYLEEFLQ